MKHLLYTFALFPLFSSSLRAQGSCAHGGAENDLLRLIAHANMVVGDGKSDDFNHALHGHDPERGLKLQGLELGAFSNLTTYVQGFANLNLYVQDGKAENCSMVINESLLGNSPQANYPVTNAFYWHHNEQIMVNPRAVV